MSIADRELLELAAKAAGIKGRFDDDEAMGEGFWINGDRTPDNDKYWNPLEKDGDALRLAVKLHLLIDVIERKMTVVMGRNLPGRFVEYFADHADEGAATRLAILRAAAWVGKAMP